jgi:hypothetical protein
MTVGIYKPAKHDYVVDFVIERRKILLPTYYPEIINAQQKERQLVK